MYDQNNLTQSLPPSSGPAWTFPDRFSAPLRPYRPPGPSTEARRRRDSHSRWLPRWPRASRLAGVPHHVSAPCRPLNPPSTSAVSRPFPSNSAVPWGGGLAKEPPREPRPCFRHPGRPHAGPRWDRGSVPCPHRGGLEPTEAGPGLVSSKGHPVKARNDVRDRRTAVADGGMFG